MPAGLRITGAEEREEDREDGLRASSWGLLAADDAVGVGAAKEMGGTRERTIVVIVF